MIYSYLLSNVKQEPAIFYNEINADETNYSHDGNINDIVISQLNQEADIFYDGNISTGTDKNNQCEIAEGMVKA